MMHAGLDLSRRRLEVQLVNEQGEPVERLAAVPTVDGLRDLAARVARHQESVRAVIESMTGARFIHDQLELLGWDVAIADAVKAKGLAPLTCKTDRIDAWVLAQLSRLNLVPEIWLPDPAIRADRERARWRLHLVRHRTALKNRIHQTLISFGHACPVSDLFGARGRELLRGLALPEPWQGAVIASLQLIDHLDRQIDACEAELHSLGEEQPYVSLLRTVPGIGWVLAYTIAGEIGDISRFASPAKLVSYTGLCPSVRQSGDRDYRGPLTKQGPKYLRWALIEAAQHAAMSSRYRDRYQAIKRRLGCQRGTNVATVAVARELAKAIWYMLIRNQPFAPRGANVSVAA